MTAKSDRRARKRARKQPRVNKIPHCDDCGYPDLGNDGYSANHTTWDGVAVVAWCKRCGHDTAS